MRLMNSILIIGLMMCFTENAFGQEGSLAEPAADSIPDDLAARQAPWGQSNIETNRRDRIYTIGDTSESVSVVAPIPLSFLGRFRVRSGAVPYSSKDIIAAHKPANAIINYAPNDKTLAVVTSRLDIVSFVDTRSNATTYTKRFSGHPAGAYYSPDGKSIWVPVPSEYYISVIDSRSLADRFKIKTTNAPGLMAFSNNGRYAFVCSDSGPRTVVFEVKKRMVLTSLTQGASSCSSIAATPDGKQIWSVSADTGQANVFSAKPPFKIIRRVPVGRGASTVTFVSNDDGQFAYLPVGAQNLVRVVDTQSFETVANIHVGPEPRAIWPSGDGSRVYVGSVKQGMLDVIDPTSQSVVGSVETGRPVASLAYVPYAARSGSDRSGLRSTATD